jgi:hypothetical protein
MKAFIDSAGQPQANAYFRMFPREPLARSGMAEVRFIDPVRHWSLDRLLTAIAREPAGSDIMIVSHGASGGLSIQLGGSIAGLGQDTMNAFGQVERGELNDADIGSIFIGMLPAAVRSLVAIAQAVRRLRLGLVVFRSCNLGAHPEILEKLRGFLGANAVCAPTLFDFFGFVDVGNPTTDQTVWSRWQSRHPDAVVYGERGNSFALEIRNDHETFAMADSWSAVTSWVGQHLPPGTYTGRGRFYLHALMNSERFFPMQSGYREHLRRQP